MDKLSIKTIAKILLKGVFLTLLFTPMGEGAEAPFPNPHKAHRTLRHSKWIQPRIGTTEYKTALYERFPIIQTTGIKGDLTSEKLKEWLERARLINPKFFQHPNCLTITKGKRGASTKKLFLVKVNPNCPEAGPSNLVLIIKELPSKLAKWDTEMSNLSILQKYPKLRALGKPRDSSLPQLTFVEDFLSYQDGKGHQNYLTLIHAAKGESLEEMVTKDPQGPETLGAFKKLGEVLANFQKRFMTGKNCLLKGGDDINQCYTISHEDLHPGNVFFDQKTGLIYFIDMETMRRSLERKLPLLKDAIDLYFIPQYDWKLPHYDKAYNAFFRAYLDQLSTDPAIRLKIWTEFNEQKSRKAAE
ncbi:MAG TPA: hypothetical protein VJL87_06310, partial [Bdellovibrionota bacterium]|nr:hypothetical protein [Bdellovibrionota bacterium]